MSHPPTDPFDLPYRTVSRLLAHRADERGEDPAARFDDAAFTYGELNRRANALAHGLAADGIEAGDHIATMLYNFPELLLTWFAVAKLGAVFVPMNVEAPGETLAYKLGDSDVDAVVLESEIRDRYESARGESDVGIEYLLDGRSGETATDTGTGPNDGYRDFDVLLGAERTERPAAAVSLDDPMGIIFTSGTTGRPKGVVLPHFSYVNTGLEFARSMRPDADSRPFTALPLYHCNAQQLTVMGSMIAGSRFAVARWFSASSFWDQARRYGATQTNLLGEMLTMLANQPERPDDDNDIRYVSCAHVPEGMYEVFAERFGVRLAEGYGLTEVATSAARNPIDDVREGSFGKPLPHIELAVVDEHNRRLPPGEEGELVVQTTRPSTMTTGYYGHPEKTVADWQNLWFHIGDIGYRDEDGYFYFVERKAHVIRHRGENVSAPAVETVVNDHPAVAESAVIGVPSDLGEEDVTAYVVLEGDAPQPAALVDWLADRLASYELPRHVQFVDALPKTPTERVQRYELRDRGVDDAWDRHAGE